MKAFLILLGLALLIPGRAQDDRIALVIGNGEYKSAPDLQNPVSDAYLLSFSLEDLGFEVASITNANRKKMEASIEDFLLRSESAEFALIYYSGHGMGVKRTNYLLPVDEKNKGIDLHELAKHFREKSVQNKILIVDAAREGFNGLEAMEAAPGLVIAFSTSPGVTTGESKGSNGLYAEKLTQQMMVSQSVNALFLHTGMLVAHASKGKQQPVNWTGLDETIGLKQGFVPGDPGAGSIILSSAFSGSVSLNGLEIGSVEAGGMVPLENMEEGTYDVRVAGDEVWEESVLVLKGQVSNVNAVPEQPAAIAVTPDAVAAVSRESGELFVDPRDNRGYAWQEYGSQTWMCSNLNFAADKSYCYMGNDENCDKYGRLYTWEAALMACPEGWHLPTDEEWIAFEQHLGMKNLASKSVGLRGKTTSYALKDTVQGLWSSPREQHFRAIGFNAVPAGYNLDEKTSVQMGESTIFWTATESNTFEAYYRKLVDKKGGVHRFEARKEKAFSVRCVKD